ncbi:hypothetical protein ID866_8255 [Astraeus odoratus]|nr:hypothetical protein ID866_8255 [Astraeus odoratus]
MTAVQEVNRKPIAQRSPPQPDGISAAAWNALDLCCNLRGIGWNWSEGVYFPEPMFKTDSRLFFTVLSLMRFMLYWTALDALDLSVKAFAPEGSAGWSIFDPSLPPVQRYLRSIFITGLSGFAAVAMIEVLYQFHAVLFTACFQQHPSLWPPLFDQPWFATSLANLWGKRWHQLFREYFSAVGTKPLEGILGQYSVIGAFVLSGLLHDIGLRGMGHGGDFLHVAGFFVVQGLGLVLERLWARLTGKRVGGILGGVWVWVWQLVWGVYLVNAWAEKGLIAKSEFFVAPYTPVTLLLNVLQKILPKY